MRVTFLVALSLTLATPLIPGPGGLASAQYRVQETPALNGLGMFLFKDIELRLDGGFGNTSATSEIVPGQDVQTGTQRYWGVFVDKPLVGHFLEMAYDLEFWQRDWLPRDTPLRDLLEAIRVIAFYRQGEFHVSGQVRNSEFYVGARYSLDLGRIARHLPVFQK